MTGFISLRQA